MEMGCVLSAPKVTVTIEYMFELHQAGQDQCQPEYKGHQLMFD